MPTACLINLFRLCYMFCLSLELLKHTLIKCLCAIRNLEESLGSVTFISQRNNVSLNNPNIFRSLHLGVEGAGVYCYTFYLTKSQGALDNSPVPIVTGVSDAETDITLSSDVHFKRGTQFRR